MCRWFSYLSEEEVLLADPLLKPKHSIVKQISAHWLPDIHVEYMATDDGSPNIFSNVDGFGVAWYTKSACEFDPASSPGLRPCLYKTVRPPLNDRNLLSIAENVSSTCIVAHVRAATGLAPVNEQNSHPYVFGRFTFAHNGTVACFFDIKPALLGLLSPAARRNILGTTDTEHAAALFFTHLDPAGPWTKSYSLEELKAAFQKTFQTLHDLIESVKRQDGEHSSLNFIVTDGEQMLASRYAYPIGTEPPSLYYSQKAGPALNSKFEDAADPEDAACDPVLGCEPRRKEEYKKHVIIASEPTTYRVDDWHLIEANSMLAVGKDLEVVISKI
ncbi:glutamine amidotransferase class-II [Meredithblackwellia eburnea MCA 4105]